MGNKGITGKNTGTAIITAMANGLSVSANIIVKKENISINEEKIILYEAETKRLKTNAGKNDSVLWNSSDKKVAVVGENGTLTAIGEGKAVITVSSNGTTDRCEIMVKKAKTRIGEDQVELRTRGTEKTYQLGVQVTGRKKAVKWTSSDKSVVSVNSKGKVTAKKNGAAINSQESIYSTFCVCIN